MAAIDIPGNLSSPRPQSVIEVIAQMDEIRSAAVKQRLLSKADQILRAEGLKKFQWGIYSRIPHMVSQAREEMNKLLDSVAVPPVLG